MKPLILITYIYLSHSLQSPLKKKDLQPTLTGNDRFEIQDLLTNLYIAADQAVMDHLNGEPQAVDDFVNNQFASALHDDFVLTLNGRSENKEQMMARFATEMKTYTASHHIIQPFGFLSYDVSYEEDGDGVRHMIEDVSVSYSSRIYRGFNNESPILFLSTGTRKFRREDAAAFKNMGGDVTVQIYTTNLNKIESTILSKNDIVNYNGSGWNEYVMQHVLIVAFVLSLITNISVCYWCCFSQNRGKVRYKDVDRDSEDSSC